MSRSAEDIGAEASARWRTAIIDGALGFEPEPGRGLFVQPRSAGILAHAWEQKPQGARIEGPTPERFPSAYTGVPRGAVPELEADH